MKCELHNWSVDCHNWCAVCNKWVQHICMHPNVMLNHRHLWLYGLPWHSLCCKNLQHYWFCRSVQSLSPTLSDFVDKNQQVKCGSVWFHANKKQTNNNPQKRRRFAVLIFTVVLVLRDVAFLSKDIFCCCYMYVENDWESSWNFNGLRWKMEIVYLNLNLWKKAASLNCEKTLSNFFCPQLHSQRALTLCDRMYKLKTTYM